ncbi:aquaporin AQPAe.a-like [Bacillus rossius redtenbacheri]|uniref:aquaporin AQPAe.a-like n=1 Tax=Bacillus rossius redtenbacheri TaxID=93214 RepID=UPI002FDCDCAE
MKRLVSGLDPGNRCRAATVLLAEFTGTALLVFLSCLANTVLPTAPHPTHLQKALATGMSVATVIQVFSHISDAHLNPAVTLSAVVLGRVDLALALVYLGAECSGAVAGSALAEALLPASLGVCELCVTKVRADLSLAQAVLLESVATFVLVLTVSASWDSRNRDKQDSLPLKFGFLVTTMCALLDPFTGASMNPARSLGPALLTGRWEAHWVYWVGPITGGLLASSFYRLVFGYRHFACLRQED